MNLRRNHQHSAAHSRRGLAPLEFVLSLPILLMVMALMVNYAHLACWKLRAANVARDAAWSARWPRSGQTPWPVGWPASATRTLAAAGNLPVLAEPSIDLPIARGPVIGQIPVNRDLLDPTRGLVQGESTITVTPPLLGKLGRFPFDVRHPLLDDAWQYPRMGMASNQQRREPIIYNLPKADQSVVQAFINAVSAVYYSPSAPALAPLDSDDEIFAFYGSYHDFHPRLAGFCSLNKDVIHRTYVLPLIDRIQGKKKPHVAGVPETMGRFFLAMYRAQAAANPALAPGLQNKIQQLQAFVAQFQ